MAGALALGGACTLENAAEIKRRLEGWLQPGGGRLDLSGVAEADLSLLQLVLATRRAAEAAGGALLLRPEPAAGVRALAESAGLLADPAERAFWEGTTL